jgi:hypothetical protein
MTSTRALVMVPGRCTSGGRPAEQHKGSRRWWHTGESCRPRYAVVHPGDVPPGPLGRSAEWPPRFTPTKEAVDA